MSIHQAIGERHLKALVLCNPGTLYCNLSDYAAAQNHCRQALETTHTIGDRGQSGYTLAYLGQALEGLGDPDADRAVYPRRRPSAGRF